MQVADRMDPNPVTITPADTLRQALVLMQDDARSSLPVIWNGWLVGVITRDDIFEAIEGGTPGDVLGSNGLDAVVGEAMSAVPVVTQADSPLSSPAVVMNVMDLDELPVVEGKVLVGVLDRASVMAEAIEALREVERLNTWDAYRKAA